MAQHFDHKIAVIGSTAWLGSGRTPSDIDIVGKFDDVVEFCRVSALQHSGTIYQQYPASEGNKLITKIRAPSLPDPLIIEAEIAWSGSNSEELLQLIVNDRDSTTTFLNGIVVTFAPLTILYLLKMSHRFVRNSPHFHKTRSDIKRMREQADVAWPFPEHYADFYKRRLEVTYDYNHPKLNQDSSTFFSGDGVEYLYNHDDIHRAVAIRNNSPAYLSYIEDGQQVNCSREKFWAAGHSVRINGVLEECYVLALERSIIPYKSYRGDHPDPESAFKTSFLTALEKVCTSITSGWFREFAWESYDQVCDLYSSDFVGKFLNALQGGMIQPYEKPTN